MSSTIPKKPLLNGLNGTYELTNDTRSMLNIPPGVLVGVARNWSNVDFIIQNYFKSIQSTSLDSKQFLQEIQATFTKLETCNNVKVQDYAKKLNVYYSNSTVCKQFYNAFNDAKLGFEAKKSEERAILQGQVTAGVLAVEGGIHLANNSRKRAEREEEEQEEHLAKRQSHENNEVPATTNRHLERVPSDLTDDYHPRRKESYTFEISEDDLISEGEPSDHPVANWRVEPNIDLALLCYQYKENTLKLPNRPEQLSDVRLLALHDIYLFDPSNQSKSVGKYWSHSVYKAAVDDIPYPDPPQGQHSATWCASMSLKRYRDWTVGLADVAKNLVDAAESGNVVDTHCMQAAVQLVPLFISSPLSYSIEDTYVHNWISPLLKPIFSCEPLLTIEWANRHITQEHKPDFIASVKGVNSWLPIIVGEFKRPGFTSSFETDLVKVGKDLRTMINKLVNIGVDNPSVGAILIQGRAITTFKMDIIAPKCYRLVSLATLTMFDTLSDLSTLPAIVSGLIQVKEISLETARKVEVLDGNRAAQMTPLPSSPQHKWVSNSSFLLRRATPTTIPTPTTSNSNSD